MTPRPNETAAGVRPDQVAALQEAALRLIRRIRKHSEIELTLSKMSALSTLQRIGAMRVGDLARREQISKSSATRLIAKLEEMGYLARDIDPSDGRSFQVTITARGHELLAESRRRANEYLAGEIERLSEEDRTALLEALPALQALVAPRR
jgi:DNA-binding MarR family transcriptional regulator